MGEKIKEIIKDSKAVYLKYYGMCYQVDQNSFDRLRNVMKIEAIRWLVGKWGLEYIISRSALEEEEGSLESTVIK
jgi:hypothetical protein